MTTTQQTGQAPPAQHTDPRRGLGRRTSIVAVVLAGITFVIGVTGTDTYGWPYGAAALLSAGVVVWIGRGLIARHLPR